MERRYNDVGTATLQRRPRCEAIAVLSGGGIVTDTSHFIVKATAGGGATDAGADVRRGGRVHALDDLVRLRLV